jgi:hypothetical protein
VIVHLPSDIAKSQKDRDRSIAKGSSKARCPKGHPPLLPAKILNEEMENEI